MVNSSAYLDVLVLPYKGDRGPLNSGRPVALVRRRVVPCPENESDPIGPGDVRTATATLRQATMSAGMTAYVSYRDAIQVSVRRAGMAR